LLPRILLLDRENQQEMLRRGAIPATQLPSAASQQPNFCRQPVTGAIRRLEPCPSKKVIVLEDDAIVRANLENFLRRQRLDVASAPDARGGRAII